MPSGVSVTVTSNVRSVVMDLRAGASEMAPAVARALNKTADQVKVQGSRAIRDAGYNLKAKDIKSGIDVRRASLGNLRASVVAKGRPIPLIAYGARQTSKGVTVSVLKGRKLIAHAFIATMANGHKGVFIRQGAGHKKIIRNGKASWHGLPIKELFGPGIPDGLANKAVQVVLQRYIDEKFPDILEHESAWLAKKLGR